LLLGLSLAILPAWLRLPAQQQQYPMPHAPHVGGSWEGPYSPTPQPLNDPNNPWHSCCEISHAILLGKEGMSQGMVLIIQSNGSRWLWDPASPGDFKVESPGHISRNLFCSGHSADANGDIVVHGGDRTRPAGLQASTCCSTQTCPHPDQGPCGPHPIWSFVYDPATRDWAGEYQMRKPVYHTPPPNFRNFGYYYPGSVRLPDGKVLSAGGGSAPLTTPPAPGQGDNLCQDCDWTYFVNGWQYFDPSLSSWVGAGLGYLPGLPSPYEFNFYPLLTVMPSATGGSMVFAPVVTNNRSANSWNQPAAIPGWWSPALSPTARLDLSLPLGAPGQTWVIGASINKPGGAVPRNLYYPNGFLWPLQLDSQGNLASGSPRRFVVLGGCDNNDYMTGTVANPGTPHPDGGRPAMGNVYALDNPESLSSAWSSSSLPAPAKSRVYSNTVMLPSKQVLLIGGAEFDNKLFSGQGAPEVWNRERVATPVFAPELLDLAAPVAWQPCNPHISPRLYHSVALLLPDGMVLCGGGYRGLKRIAQVPPGSGQYQELPPVDPEHHTYNNWRYDYSQFEIWNPPYMFTRRRPDIVSSSVQANANRLSYGDTFDLTVFLRGSDSPASEIGSVCLISPGSVTHHYDWDQRYVGLSFSTSASGPRTLTVKAPASESLAPPGWYMLFVVTDGAQTGGIRVPSQAIFVKLE
jgi:hypothetical protein